MLNLLAKQDLNDQEEQEYKGFRVTDINSANWTFRKLHAIEEQKKEFQDLAAKEMERIQNWLQSEVRKLENQEDFFKGILVTYALEQRKENPKFKMSCPYGKIVFRKQQPKWIYEDREVIEYLKESLSSEYIRTKEELDKEKLKKSTQIHGSKVYLNETGEEILGITILEQDEAIKIEVL